LRISLDLPNLLGAIRVISIAHALEGMLPQTTLLGSSTFFARVSWLIAPQQTLLSILPEARF